VTPSLAGRFGSQIPLRGPMRLRIDFRIATTSLLVLALAASACESATAPASASGLTLETRASHFDTNIGVPARVTYTLRNDSSAPLTLVFLDCSVRPYVAKWAGGVVHPPGGQWGCLAAVTTVTLDPGEAIVRTDYVAGGDDVSYSQGTLLLPEGRYRAFAEAEFHLGTLEGPRIQLRSQATSFRIER
jgi:hypothetical protein